MRPGNLLLFLSMSIALIAASCAPAVRRLSAPPATAASLEYRVAVHEHGDAFRVTGTLKNITTDSLTIRFPIWTPGSYSVVDYMKQIMEFAASAPSGEALRVRTDTVAKSFTVYNVVPGTLLRYTASDIESHPIAPWFSGSDVEYDFAFAVGAALFGRPVGYEKIPTVVTYSLPTEWEVAIGLAPVESMPGSYIARDYDELIDAPLLAGVFHRIDFKVREKLHSIVLLMPTKPAPEQLRGLRDATRKIVTRISDFFDEIPYDHYVFQHVLLGSRLDQRAGALEHANSSTYLMPYYTSDLARLLSDVIAHEYWHVWSPKRFHVEGLGPFDYDTPPSVGSLWFAEGVTEYCSELVMLNTGLNDREKFLKTLTLYVSTYYDVQQLISITELGRRITELPFGQMRPLYSKGMLLALLMDISIRNQTKNLKSLESAMRYFNDEYGRKGRTFREDEIIPIIERATGARLDDFYARYIAGKENLPIDEFLPLAGLRYKIEVTGSVLRLGGLGVSLTPEGWTIDALEPTGVAREQGLQVGDMLRTLIVDTSNSSKPGNAPKEEKIAFDDIGSDRIYRFLMALPEGARRLVISRNGREETIRLNLTRTELVNERVEIDPGASYTAVAIRKSLFGF